MDPKERFYDEFADNFDKHVNMYDTRKRIHLVFDSFLKGHDLRGKFLLDAGCGTGWFSAEAEKRQARVFSIDVGIRLLEKVAGKCTSTRIVGDALDLPFRSNTFHYVISSEVIEHTRNPVGAIVEMCRIIRPGGYLCLTTPNKRWRFAISVANVLKLRPYEGYENWVSWLALRASLKANGMEILAERGFHIFPFISKRLYPLLDLFDKVGHRQIGKWMLNIGVLARKLN
jgi:2-polyprenyl-3-methyl-5-hydroxy-6-metoxy-1,4-benzoquinol methylase